MRIPHSGGVVNLRRELNGSQSTPYNIDAEQALLGALLVNSEALDRVTSFLDPVHFFDPLHGQIYEITSKLIQAGKLATPITLRTFFENAEPISPDMTVPQYLGRLAAHATTIINAADYARLIFDLSARRAMIAAGNELAARATDAPVDADLPALVAEAEALLLNVSEARGADATTVSFGQALGNVMTEAREAYRVGGRATGLSTGFRDIDNKLGGLEPGNLYIIAARPSMGKTALATDIGFYIASKRGVPVGFNSLEMPKEQLVLRILSRCAEIPGRVIRAGLYDEPQADHLERVQEHIEATPLHIDDTGGMTIGRIAACARRMKRQRKIGLLIIDYLQLMGGSRRDGNRVQEITEITTGLKALAKQLGIPIIALSQLSRQVEQRADKRPQLSDLRESGSIEQDADAVMFVYREEYYVEREQPPFNDPQHGAWQDRLAACQGKAEVIVGKQRHGPVGTVELAWDGDFTRFSNLER